MTQNAGNARQVGAHNKSAQPITITTKNGTSHLHVMKPGCVANLCVPIYVVRILSAHTFLFFFSFSGGHFICVSRLTIRYAYNGQCNRWQPTTGDRSNEMKEKEVLAIHTLSRSPRGWPKISSEKYKTHDFSQLECRTTKFENLLITITVKDIWLNHSRFCRAARSPHTMILDGRIRFPTF